MNFDNNMLKWVNIDNEIKKLNEQIKQLKEQKDNIESHLTDHIKKNNLIDKTFAFNKDKIKIVERKVPETLSFQYLEKTLGEIISDENKVNTIMNHIKQKRNIKIVSELKRYSVN